MKCIITFSLLISAFTAATQNDKCADIFADTGKYASPKNFYSQKSSNEGISWIKRFNEKTKQATYILVLRAYNPEFYPAVQKGLTITFSNNEVIELPEAQATGVKCTNQRGCVYEISITLNEEQLKKFKTSEVTSYKMGSFTTKVTDGKKHQDQLSCLEEKTIR